MSDRITPDSDQLDDPAEVLTPIPGELLGPPPKDKPEAVRDLEQRNRWAQAAWPALQRFKVANATLMAGGTAYYAFVAMFSLLAFAYGVTTLLSADADGGAGDDGQSLGELFANPGHLLERDVVGSANFEDNEICDLS